MELSFTWLQFLPNHVSESKYQSHQHWPHTLASPPLFTFWKSRFSTKPNNYKCFFCICAQAAKHCLKKKTHTIDHTFRTTPTELSLSSLASSLVYSPQELLQVSSSHFQNLHCLIIRFMIVLELKHLKDITANSFILIINKPRTKV